MEQKQYRLPDQENHFISSFALEKLLRQADGNIALVYLYILKQQGKFHPQNAIKDLHMSEQEVYESIRTLVKHGLISGPAPQEDKPAQPLQQEESPQYTAAEIQRELEDPAFSALVKEVSAMLGKILTTPDLTILMGLYRSLGLPAEVIYQLVSHLTAEHRERYGAGKAPTLRGIEKIAYVWAKDDITTLDAALRHIEKRTQLKTQVGQLKKVLHLQQSPVTPGQEKYMAHWLNLGFPIETIAIAYDKTILQTGQLKWNYLDAILKSWHEKGTLTVEAIEQNEPRQATKQAKRQSISPTAPDPQELARRKQLMDRVSNR